MRANAEGRGGFLSFGVGVGFRIGSGTERIEHEQEQDQEQEEGGEDVGLGGKGRSGDKMKHCG